jgi:hypothetical protein
MKFELGVMEAALSGLGWQSKDDEGLDPDIERRHSGHAIAAL